MPPPPATEILVHVAAASRASDDARYRALAQAYAAFEPARRLDIAVGDGGAGGSMPAGPSVEQHQYCPPASSVLQSGTASTNAGGGSFQFANLSFESVWDNVQSPGLLKAVTGPTPGRALLPPPPSRRDRLHYVSPDDYIPDSQPDNESKTRRQHVAAHKVDVDESMGSLLFCRASRIVESQTTSGSVNNEAATCMRREASPDLSVMPVEQADDTCGELDDSQSARQPLSQRSVNAQLSSQNSGAEDSKESFTSSPPPHDWDAVPSSLGVASLESGNRQPARYVDIPSSLPEESGRVVLRVDASASERRGLLESLPSSCGALELAGADSEPTRTKIKRQRLEGSLDGSPRGRASEAGPLPKKKKRLTSATDDEETDGADTGVLSGNDLCVFRSLTQSFPSSSPTASAPSLYLDQSLRIISPEPPVACAHLDASLVTEKMAKLARDLDITRRYRPLSMEDGDQEREQRDIRPFERGYWRLSTSGWPAPLRQQAWAFLASYIGAGDAGWSVWCSRDPAPHTWLRLHCFAATAGHTYLILYLASKRQILATGAEWLDGAGSPMITVPPRRKKLQL
ncbi:hypothetical protein SCUCBS95973_004988 [Sporothrix curviconia]|uniref:Uncharacterized protein n=1 Tax=Sporothrix curviconia TaxID=1260050 RepID=A0ABP0BU12_9PEZI